MKVFKVLTIDGGGMKGYYSAKILSLFEADLKKKYGCDTRIVDYADLICGTSTGGLIALALASRIPTETICEFYEKKGPLIFKNSQGVFALLRQTILGGKFSDKQLKSALREMFHERTIGDSDCLLCIPSYDFSQGTYALFKYDHKEGNLSRHNSLPMVDIALATSAAPTFFPLAQIKKLNETQYVDGGVWANNPSLVGFTEAAWYFVGPRKSFDHLSLLSISSLNYGTGKPPFLNRRRSFVQWTPELFDLSLIGQSEFSHFFMNLLQQQEIFPMTYSRIPSAKISLEQAPYIRLDLASEKSIALMKQFAEDMYFSVRNNPKIQLFFSQPKTYCINKTKVT